MKSLKPLGSLAALKSMRPSACPCEEVVLRQLAEQGSLDAAMTAHLEACVDCHQVVALVQALRVDGAVAQQEAVLPTSSQVWWRARVRSRLEAARDAERPISIVQSLTAAALAGLAVSLVSGASLLSALHAMLQLVARTAGDQTAPALIDVSGASTLGFAFASPLGWAMVLGCGVLVVMMPLAALIAARD